ncbi:hypothetical protein PsalMR5_01190 [Piscirickettsia salmonis]|nr:hypothetical protein PsalMR5_01190 [Piscirickettsia salmonis]
MSDHNKDISNHHNRATKDSVPSASTTLPTVEIIPPPTTMPVERVTTEST